MATNKQLTQAQIAALGAKWDRYAQGVIKEIKQSINSVKDPARFVEGVFRRRGMDQFIQDGSLDGVVGLLRENGFEIDARDGEDLRFIRKTWLNKTWAEDGLTLSERIARSPLRAEIANTISASMEAARSWTDTARQIQATGALREEIPAYLDDLIKQGRKVMSDVSPTARGRLLRQIRNTMKRVDAMVEKGASIQVKKAYAKIVKLVEDGSEVGLDATIQYAMRVTARRNAERIARSEIAKAYRDAQVTDGIEDPDVVGWRSILSAGHPRPDICDFYAEANLYGLGPGVYPKDQPPPIPYHPNCMCSMQRVYIGNVKVFNSSRGVPTLKKMGRAKREILMGKAGADAFAKQPLNWQRHLRNWEKPVAVTPATIIRGATGKPISRPITIAPLPRKAPTKPSVAPKQRITVREVPPSLPAKEIPSSAVETFEWKATGIFTTTIPKRMGLRKVVDEMQELLDENKLLPKMRDNYPYIVKRKRFSNENHRGEHNRLGRITMSSRTDHLRSAPVTYVHETGHAIDTHIGGFGNLTKGDMQAASEMSEGPVKDIIDKLRATKRYEQLVERSENAASAKSRKFFAYLIDPKELFARSYAQYVANRTKNKLLYSAWNEDSIINFYDYWDADDFAPVKEAFDKLFAEYGI